MAFTRSPRSLLWLGENMDGRKAGTATGQVAVREVRG
jgi:hypothetical protein